MRNNSQQNRTDAFNTIRNEKRTLEGVRGSHNMPMSAGITLASTVQPAPPGTASGFRKARFGSSFPDQFFDARNSRMNTPFTDQ